MAFVPVTLIASAALAVTVPASSFDTYDFIKGEDTLEAELLVYPQAGGARLLFQYDFSKGGRYVLYKYQGFVPSRIEGLSFEVELTKPVIVMLRIVDDTGQTVTRLIECLATSRRQKITWDLTPESLKADHCDEIVDGKLAQPIRELLIGVAYEDPRKTGTTSAKPSMTEEQRLEIARVKGQFKGNWQPQEVKNDVWMDRLAFETSLPDKQIQRERYLINPNFSVTSATPGFLFFPAEPVRLFLTISKPPEPEQFEVSGVVECEPKPTAFGKSVTAPTCVLGPDNNYQAEITIPLNELGYYEAHWKLRAGEDYVNLPTSSLAIIPHNPQDKQRPDSQFGVNTAFIGVWPEVVATMAKRVGIAWVRDGLRLPYGYPDDPASGIGSNGEKLADQQELVWAEKNNLCYLGMVGGTLEGMVEKDGCWTNPKAERGIEDWVRRYKGRISTVALNNEPWGPWGEHFGGDWQEGGPWIKAYTEYSKAMTRAVHRAAPSVKVLWTELDIFKLTPMFLKAGGLPELQHIEPHIYSRRWRRYPEDDPFVQSMPEVRRYLRDHGMQDEIWVTETGYTTFKVKYYWGTTYWPETESEQAEKLMRMIIMQLYGGAAKVFAHNFMNMYSNPYHPEGGFGLMRADQQPKPSVVAYSNLISWLTDSKWIGKCEAGKDVYAYAFVRPDSTNPVIVAWVKEGKGTLELPLLSGVKKIKVTNSYGQSREISVTGREFTKVVTESPVYIEGLESADVMPRMKLRE